MDDACAGTRILHDGRLAKRVWAPFWNLDHACGGCSWSPRPCQTHSFHFSARGLNARDLVLQQLARSVDAGRGGGLVHFSARINSLPRFRVSFDIFLLGRLRDAHQGGGLPVVGMEKESDVTAPDPNRTEPVINSATVPLPMNMARLSPAGQSCT
jgi:hypothetical protein